MRDRLWARSCDVCGRTWRRSDRRGRRVAQALRQSQELGSQRLAAQFVREARSLVARGAAAQPLRRDRKAWRRRINVAFWMAPCASRLSASRLNGEPGRSLSSPRCGPARHRGERSGNERRLGQFEPALHDRRIGQARLHPAPSPARPYSSAGQFPQGALDPPQRASTTRDLHLGMTVVDRGRQRDRSHRTAVARAAKSFLAASPNSVRKFIPPLWANSIVSRRVRFGPR